MSGKNLLLVVLMLMTSFIAGCGEKSAPVNVSEKSLADTSGTAGELDSNQTKSAEDAVKTETTTENQQGIKENNRMNIQVGDTTFSVTLEDNSSAEALKDFLLNGEITLSLSDYAGMEKVGNLGTTLPRNDQQIDTVPGDIILYQGNQFVFYYGTNSWSLTRLGKVNNASAAEIRKALGNGNVQVTLSLE